MWITRDWRDFKSLNSNFAGARVAFENACESLFRKYYKHHNVQQVEVKQGDGGIDIFIGNYGTEPITVIQCKFFLDEIKDSQKQQIRDSFNKAIKSKDYKLKNWILAVPRVLVQDEHQWWGKWKKRMELVYSERENFIEIKTGNELIDLLKQYDLYEQIFQIRIPPSEKILSLLKFPSEWDKDIGNINYSYHKQYPEYQIKFSEPEKVQEAFSFFYLNPESYLGVASFYYNSIKLFELEYIYVDEMRHMISVPSLKNIRLDEKNWYYYYDLSTKKGCFYYFLTDGNLDQSIRGEDCQFLFFKNEAERIAFENFLKNNLHQYEIKPRVYAEIAVETMKRENYNVSINPLFVDRVRQLYEIWKQTLE